MIPQARKLTLITSDGPLPILRCLLCDKAFRDTTEFLSHSCAKPERRAG